MLSIDGDAEGEEDEEAASSGDEYGSFSMFASSERW